MIHLKQKLPYPWTVDHTGNPKHCIACGEYTFRRYYKWDGCRILEELVYCFSCSKRFETMLRLAE